ncbi:MAG: hypothetical protein JWM64_588 [Frankiales bacterium]|nr:hypothetical protein [Frankiales bacterium]
MLRQTAAVRRSALVLPVLLLVALSACGGDDDAPSRPTPAPAPTTAAPSAVAEVPLEGPRAAAVAGSIVLRKADVPGLTADDVDASDDGQDDPLAACLAGPGSPLATSESAGFSKGAAPDGYLVGNSTDVVATTQEGVEDFAALTAPTVLACLDEAAPAAFGGSVDGTFARVPTTAPPGADNAARYVLTGTFGTGKGRFAVRLGLSAVLVGRAEISVFDVGYGPSGLPGKERDRLIALLVRRAQSAQHLDGF